MLILVEYVLASSSSINLIREFQSSFLSERSIRRPNYQQNQTRNIRDIHVVATNLLRLLQMFVHHLDNLQSRSTSLGKVNCMVTVLPRQIDLKSRSFRRMGGIFPTNHPLTIRRKRTVRKHHLNKFVQFISSQSRFF